MDQQKFGVFLRQLRREKGLTQEQLAEQLCVSNRSGSRGSYVPAREFADTPRDPEARPQAPAPVERIHDGDDFAMFGKIEL